MKRFTPSMCQEPSSCLTALVRPAPTSEPASGSVSTMVGAPAALGGQHGPLLLLLGAEVVEISREARAHRVHVRPPGWRRGCARSGPTAARGASACRRVPRATPILSQPPSSSARTDFLNDSGSVTVCVLGSNTGGLRSASANDSAIGPSASLAISPSISRAVSTSRSVYVALTEHLVDAEDLEQVEYLVTDVALVVAHCSSSSRMPLAVGYFGLSYPPVTGPNYTAQ